MASKSTLLVAGSFLAWGAAVTFSGVVAQGSVAQKTTNDGLYTQAQADGAKALYNKVCVDCHPFTVAAKKKPKDLPLGEDPFFEEWEGRSVRELISIIALTMPNDGSAVISDQEATDLVAYILQQNGFPAGSAPLDKSAAAAIERPKK
ncbi:MAG: cytochrome c [Acidobacteria bacterium]|nr:cytochrome c [Acidobacteriota bacterium]